MLSFVSLLMLAQAPAAPELRVVRSLCAEAALQIQLERRHRISETYAAQMRKLAGDALQTDAQSGAQETARFARSALRALARKDEVALLGLVSEISKRIDL
jgi:hypothetical protein